jgi:hypothetical protein
MRYEEADGLLVLILRVRCLSTTSSRPNDAYVRGVPNGQVRLTIHGCGL